MKPLIVSYSDINGGAARAAYRLHKAFTLHHIHSKMMVSRKSSDDPDVISPQSKMTKAGAMLLLYLSRKITKLQKTSNTVLHSLNIFPSGLYDRINDIGADVVNLHWINHEAVSVEQVGRIKKPVVFTLHDMWAFCGAEHYYGDHTGARFVEGYETFNRPRGHGGIDLDRWIWSRKKKYWTKPRHVVCPSNWLADCARSSALMRDWPIHVIPYAIDLDRFRPLDKSFCRSALGLPLDSPIIAFGAIGGTRDPRKGYDLLQSAIDILSPEVRLTEIKYIVFGQSQPKLPSNCSSNIQYMGYLHDDWSLALLYNSADAMVVPSRQEAFGQTASEAQACGCPVVAFNATGLKDVVEDRKTGYLAEPFSPEDLARGIKWVLEDPERGKTLSRAARDRAERLWNPGKVVDQYMNVYQEAIDQDKRL